MEIKRYKSNPTVSKSQALSRSNKRQPTSLICCQTIAANTLAKSEYQNRAKSITIEHQEQKTETRVRKTRAKERVIGKGRG